VSYNKELFEFLSKGKLPQDAPPAPRLSDEENEGLRSFPL
jgi:hypothetical protein